MNAIIVQNHSPLQLAKDDTSCGRTKPMSCCTENKTLAPPEGFICPLTLEVMDVPVMTVWGHNFEKSALIQWLEKKGENYRTCPLTRLPLTMKDLVTNRPLQAKIQYWKHQKATSSLFYVPDSEGCEKLFLDKIQSEMDELNALRKSMLRLRQEKMTNGTISKRDSTIEQAFENHQNVVGWSNLH